MKLITRVIAALLLAGNAVSAAPAGTAAAGTLEPAAGRFLVASRGLYGPYFSKSVIYLLQHNSTGTVGLIVNRPLGRNVAEVLPDVTTFGLGGYPVYNGGPVNPNIMVMLFRGSYSTELAVHVDGDVYASSNSAILEQMMTEQKPARELRMFAGQAGWLPGQLARELVQGSWHVTDGDPDTLFAGGGNDLWIKLIDRLDPLGILVMDQFLPAPRL
ncbi:MAG: YqgE/AlgH family protein [Gammaproteobacteria bacterium]